MGKREIQEFLEKISKKYGEIDADKVEFAEQEESIVYILDDKIELIKNEELIFPFLGGSIVERLPSVIVDMGAIRFVCNGADIMAPGITKLDYFSKEDVVVIRDNTHGKALAVGVALKFSEEINSLKKGKVITNLHYVGDELWESLS
jgi:PUA domain protein